MLGAILLIVTSILLIVVSLMYIRMLSRYRAFVEGMMMAAEALTDEDPKAGSFLYLRISTLLGGTDD